jgi:hypothetical protein
MRAYGGQKRTSEPSMRDWLFMLGPPALFLYFVVNPDQFHAFANWVAHMIW